MLTQLNKALKGSRIIGKIQ